MAYRWYEFDKSRILGLIGKVLAGNMRLRPTTLSPLLRFAAAGTLLAWLTAVAACVTHCAMGVGDSRASGTCCKERAEGTAAPAAAPSFTCLVLKSALLTGDGVTLAPPDYPVDNSLAFPGVLIAGAPPALIPAKLRETRSRDWVFAPEVSLGPAFRSLAPPLLC